jgi:hypothetical protein
VVPTEAELLAPPPLPPAKSASFPEHAAKITVRVASDQIDVAWAVPAWQTFEVVMCPFGECGPSEFERVDVTAIYQWHTVCGLSIHSQVNRG